MAGTYGGGFDLAADAGSAGHIHMGECHRAPDFVRLHKPSERLAERGGWSLTRSWDGSYYAKHPVHGVRQVMARDDATARRLWRRLMDSMGVTEGGRP